MSVLDVGCGSGAFTLGAARRGYETVGPSWDERDQAIAMSRAKLLGLTNVSFPICDVRRLDERRDSMAVSTSHCASRTSNTSSTTRSW